MTCLRPNLGLMIVFSVITSTMTSSLLQSNAARDIPVRQSLLDLEDEFWNWRMKDAPMFSTSVGETRHNDVLESFEPDVYNQRKTAVSSFLKRLQSLDRTQLNKTERLDYDIFTQHLQTFLDGSVWNSYFTVNPVDFLEGINSNPSRMETVMPLHTIGDFDNYIQRINLLPKQVDQQIALLRTAISTNHTLNNVSVRAVPSQLDKLIQATPEESQFYTPAFTSKLNSSDVPVNERSSLQSRAQTAVKNVQQALQRLKTTVVEEYMPATRSTWGVSGWADGKEVYQQCLRYHTSTAMTPDEIHQLGFREVDRIQKLMREALTRLKFTGSIKQFYDSIRKDPRFHKNSSDALFSVFEDYVNHDISPKMNTLFKDIPDLPLEIKKMPFQGPSGFYLAGTPSGSVPGIFYANVQHPQDEPTIPLMALTLHESIPGHHLQSIYSMTASLPKYRSLMEDDHYYRMPATFPINTAYTEGWGLYSEYLGEELGLYTDDYMLMGRYSYEILRACRLVVDTGLHYYGWERERAIQYMLDNTAESVDSVTLEVDRYLTWPGQATAYKIGEIKLKELRQKAHDSLGSRFDVRDFHSVILQNGGMPLTLLERLVVDWIAEVKAAGQGSTVDEPIVGK